MGCNREISDMKKKFFHWALLPLVVLCGCGNEPANYVFEGTVVIDNRCNRNFEELPQRIKLSYAMDIEGEEAKGEQDMDLEPAGGSSKKGKYSISLLVKNRPHSLSVSVTRPNGSNICHQLPCPSPMGCTGNNKIEVQLRDNQLAYSDTLKFSCDCR